MNAFFTLWKWRQMIPQMGAEFLFKVIFLGRKLRMSSNYIDTERKVWIWILKRQIKTEWHKHVQDEWINQCKKNGRVKRTKKKCSFVNAMCLIISCIVAYALYPVHCFCICRILIWQKLLYFCDVVALVWRNHDFSAFRLDDQVESNQIIYVLSL